MLFRNREEAGFVLAQHLAKFRGTNSVVVTLPRGGVPLGHVVARELCFPLDVILIKKIGYPGHAEYAIGAVSLHSMVRNPDIDLPEDYYLEQAENIRNELQKRYELYKGARHPVDLKGKTVLLVDDGIATGYTMMAAAQLIRADEPASIVIAVPVASPRVLDKLSELVEEIICVYAPTEFKAVGQFYQDFSEVTHDEVIRLLAARDIKQDEGDY